MKQLKTAIIENGTVLNESVLKVDAFLNHQIDPALMQDIGAAFYNYFKDHEITKVVTIETSGIAPSLMCALLLGVPVVFIKKVLPSTMSEPYTSTVHSFTKNKTYTICMDRKYIDKNDTVLFIDDFLANGEAFQGVEDIIKQANASIKGVGIVIEKAFQKGHRYILDNGYDLYALASIKSFKNNTIEFEE